jgi:hypothetical protein
VIKIRSYAVYNEDAPQLISSIEVEGLFTNDRTVFYRANKLYVIEGYGAQDLLSESVLIFNTEEGRLTAEPGLDVDECGDYFSRKLITDEAIYLSSNVDINCAISLEDNMIYKIDSIEGVDLDMFDASFEGVTDDGKTLIKFTNRETSLVEIFKPNTF